MVNYKVTVYTGNYEEATTLNDVFIMLVGTNGESERTILHSNKLTAAFSQGEVSRFNVSCDTSLGDLVLIKLDKQPHDPFPVDKWFPDKVEVTSEEERTYKFPIYRWITDTEVYTFNEGTALTGSTGVCQTPSAKSLVSDSDDWQNSDIEVPNEEIGLKSLIRLLCEMSPSNTKSLVNECDDCVNERAVMTRTRRPIQMFCSNVKSLVSDDLKKELMKRQEEYRWMVYKEGLPHCIEADSPDSLPCDVQFFFSKEWEVHFTAAAGLGELKLKGLADCNERWTNMDDMSRVFWCRSTKILEHVNKHWRDDAFFSYQFLNGVNPMMIRRCTALPSNCPVTDDMVFLHGHSLAEEMKNGNIFLCDYKNLDGLQPNIINGKKQYLMAPLVLLHKTPHNKLMPVAIQLKQTPAEDNPIFVPTDSEYDWLLAKTFVRSADFNEHQLSSHLLRTHLLAEVFAVSLLRNIPSVHPLYKLLMPHTRYTLHINILTRNLLISEDGAFTKYAASGGEAMITILQRSLSSVTYRSLCIRDDIADRGLESVPNFYYRDDGFKLWDIIHRFVQGVLEYYYKSDAEVQKDSELQKWIGDIFEHGFLSNESTGIPQEFFTLVELVKFVTMVIFTCSAQHSAVNAGQYDYGGWMPNTPTSLQHPPPTTKGVADEETLLKTLPDVNVTAKGMAVMWLLSKPSSDFVALGKYREKYFTEGTPCKLTEALQGELQKLSQDIKLRNKSEMKKTPRMSTEIPYTYMDPELMENSAGV